MFALFGGRKPVLAGNMTRAELVREAERLFPYPSPIVQRMIEELRSDRKVVHSGTESMPVGAQQCADDQCPACGARIFYIK